MTWSQRFRMGFLAYLGLSYVVAGWMHFVEPGFYLLLMPDYMSHHLELVYLSGFFEILGGIGLWVPWTRRFSAWGLIALLVAVFPANIHIVVHEIQLTAEPINMGLMYVRLPIQILFIYWIWWAALRLAPGERARQSLRPASGFV